MPAEAGIEDMENYKCLVKQEVRLHDLIEGQRDSGCGNALGANGSPHSAGFAGVGDLLDEVDGRFRYVGGRK